MSDINLISDGVQRESGNDKLNIGLVVMFIFLVLTLVAYGGLQFLNRNLTSQIASTQQEFDVKYKSLTEGNGIDVVDFQNRLDAAGVSVTETRDMSDDLTQVEKAMVPGAFIGNYKYNMENKTISLNLLADNYNTVAKQILSFKKSSAFSNVTSSDGGGNTSAEAAETEGSGKVDFSVILTLK